MDTLKADVVIIGAGMAGLAVARTVSASGASVLLVDKGRGVGGRMSSRRIVLDDGRVAHFDHGAQFFTAKGRRFRDEVAQWMREGHVNRWYRNGVRNDGATRFRGEPRMSSVPKRMAESLDVRLGQPVASVQREGDGWRVNLDGDDVLRARAAVVTAPLPQAVELLREVLAADNEWSALAVGEDAVFTPCLAALFVLGGPSGTAFPGAEHVTRSTIRWICDNQVKGVSPDVPTLTVHANVEFSTRWWTEDREQLQAELTEAVQQRSDVPIVQSAFHGWRYSFARRTLSGQFGLIQDKPPLLLAGDAFVSPKVEGAYESGAAAGAFIADALR